MFERRFQIAIVAMVVILFLLLIPVSVFGQGRGFRDYGRGGGYLYDPCADIYNPHGRIDCGIDSISRGRRGYGYPSRRPAIYGNYGYGYGRRGVAETAIISGAELVEAYLEYRLANKTIDRTYPPPSNGGGLNPVYDQDDRYRPIRSSRQVPVQEEVEPQPRQAQVQPVQTTVQPTSTESASPMIAYTVRNTTHVWVAVYVTGRVVKFLAPVGMQGSEDVVKLEFGNHTVKAFALATSDNGNVTKECRSQMLSDGSGWVFSKGGE